MKIAWKTSAKFLELTELKDICHFTNSKIYWKIGRKGLWQVKDRKTMLILTFEQSR